MVFRQNGNRIDRKWTAILLAAVMACTAVPVSAYGQSESLNAAPGVVTPGDGEISESTAGDDTFENAISGNDISGNSVSEDSADSAEDRMALLKARAAQLDLPALDGEERDAKELLSQDLEALEDAVPGEDYAEDELVLLCDGREAAEDAADSYRLATGRRVSLDSYSFGVAVLAIGRPEEDVCTDNLLEVMEIAADGDNDLPAVYANYNEEIASVNTDREHFTDPLLKKGATAYQFFHDVIDAKPVWEAMEEGYLTSDDGRELEDVLGETVVAVIDTGINTTGQDFVYTDGDGQEQKVYTGGYCFLTGKDSDGTTLSGDTYEDKHGHGSNVSGIIADAANSYNGRGVAAGCRIMPLRTFNKKGSGGSTAVITRAILYAWAARSKYLGEDPGEDYDSVSACNVRVINMSLGGPDYSSLYQLTVNECYDRGITVCAAAGNYGMGGSYYPAALEHVISVAAVNSHGKRAYYSDYGPTVDIAAPGGDRAVGTEYGYTMTEYMYASARASSYGGSSLGRSGMMGTSQASPVVSACTAMLYAAHPDWSPEQVEYRLKETATGISDQTLGAGIVNLAAAMGVEETPEAPEIVSPAGTMISENSVRVEFEDPGEDAVIYYTLDGSDPDPDENGDALLCDPDDEDTWPLLEDDGTGQTVTIKARTLLYGNLSSCSTFTKSFCGEQVRSIAISSASGRDQISVGNSLRLTAQVLPAYASNRKVTWSSSDSAVASVTSGGLVTAHSEQGEDPVVITATASDGSGVSGNFVLEILPGVQSLTIDPPSSGTPMYDADTILLRTPDPDGNLASGAIGGYHISRSMINILPAGASGSVTFTSSNPDIASVDSDGNVYAVSGGGYVTVTVAAADGSGKKDTQKFYVETPVYEMEITDSGTSEERKDKLVAGGTLKPTVIFNRGDSVPGNRTLKWSLADSSCSSFVKMNTKTGKVSVKKTAFTGTDRDVTILASSEAYGCTASYTFHLYPRCRGLSADSGVLTDGAVCYTFSGSVVTDTLDDLIVDSPEGATLGMYSCVSSNPELINVSGSGGEASDITIRVLGIGSAKLTIRALDGSGKKLVLPVVAGNGKSYTRGSIVCKSGRSIYYPGKKLVYAFSASNDVETDSVAWTLGGSGNNVYHNFVIKSGILTRAAGTGEPTAYEQFVVTAKGVRGSTSQTTSCNVEIYPARVTSLTAAVSGDGETGISALTFDRVGQQITILAGALPANACQDYITFVSSKPEVASVDAGGTVTAERNGTAVITMTAGDGSGVTKKIRVTVAQPKCTSVSLSASQLTLATTACGEWKTRETVSVNQVLPTDEGVAFQVTSSKPGVATVNLARKAKDTDPDVYEVRAVGGGTAQIRFAALDGSGITAVCKVTVKVPVDSIRVRSNNGFRLKWGQSLRLSALTNKASDTTVSWHFTDPESMGENAVLDADTGILKTAKSGSGEQILKVYATANDPAGYKSPVVSVVVSDSTVLMKDLQVGSKTGLYDLASGKKLKMLAYTTVDATNRKVSWSVENVTGEGEEPASKCAATIDRHGMLKAAKNLTETCVVRVTARARDGSGVVGTRDVTIYPAAGSLVFTPDGSSILGSGKKYSMMEGSTGTICVRSLSKFEENGENTAPCQKYRVTWSGKCGKVYYSNENGTEVRISAFSPGTLKVKFTCLDGSGKSRSCKVQIR